MRLRQFSHQKKEEKQLFLTQKGNEHPLPKKEIDMAMEREL